MEKFEELKTLVSSLEEDAIKFYEKRNKAAGTRVRKGCQEIKNLCQDIRVEVSQLKNAETVTA
jgi:phosphate uptake regulator